MRRLLRRRARGPDARGARATLFDAARSLVEHRDFPRAGAATRSTASARSTRCSPSSRRSRALAAARADPSDWLAAEPRERRALRRARTALREAVRGRDYDGLEAELRDAREDAQDRMALEGPQGATTRPDLLRDEVLARRDAAKAAPRRSCSPTATPTSRRASSASCCPWSQHYEELKRAAGVLDFLDLLLRTRDLLVRDAAVRAELRAASRHFFVDEFQDTDPLQAEILLLLAADDPAQSDWRAAVPGAGQLFLVGDPKQSIYRFRRADVALYERIKQRLVAHGAELVQLARELPRRARDPGGRERGVRARDAGRRRTAARRATSRSSPCAPTCRRSPRSSRCRCRSPYGDYGKVVDWKIEESLPDAVGAFVDWLVRESGWTVEERGERVPVAARHVCLLFRRFQPSATT